jgi:peptide/nickel transport system ATP-binding protein
MTEQVVSLNDVEVHFSDADFTDRLLRRQGDVVKAVDGVSLDIPENEVIALVGESGCGKTTLGKTAIGLQRPTDGAITYRGQDIWDAKDGRSDVEIPYEDIRRSLQIIHQDPGSSLNANRTVLSCLSDPLKRWRSELGTEEREAMIYRLLERVGMKPVEDYASRFPHQLSGGEKQRVVLGRALMMSPDLILADEAVSALDVSLRVEMMDLMLELQDMIDTSFLFISHDFSNARYFAEKADGRIGIMYLGNLVEIGPAAEVLRNPKHPYTKVLSWATPYLDPDRAQQTRVDEPPVRDIDIPDPTNPPSACRFHTRCPSVIPPDDIDIEQETYNEVMDYRQRLERGSFDPETVWERIDSTSGSIETFKQHLFDDLFAHDLAGENRAVVEQSFEAVADGEQEQAAELLRERFESICETVEPTLQDQQHPAACHLYGSDGTEAPDDVLRTGEDPEDAEAASD